MKMYTDDELTKLDEREIKKLFMDVRSAINYTRKKNVDARDLEIYYCYITRELQVREDNKSVRK